MDVGIVKEIKPAERRVGLTPAGARELADRGHRVLVEAGAGEGAGFADAAYRAAGAEIAAGAADVWGASELVVKVKEPIEPEYDLLSADTVLFTYLHLAADRALTEALLAQGTTAIGYETVTDAAGGLPLLAPMSEIAGRLGALEGSFHLTAPRGGPGLLACGSAGVAPAEVLIVGGGVVGTQAARIALGIGARVTLLERSPARLRALDELFGGSVRVIASDRHALAEEARAADLIIGAVLVPGAVAPHLVDRAMLAELKPGVVLVDVAIDQGGCFETSHPTTHDEPTFVVDGALHYCVANMPAAVPVTSTRALTNGTLPYVLRLADGVEWALRDDPGLAAGLNTREGSIACAAVAAAFPDLKAAPAAAAA